MVSKPRKPPHKALDRSHRLLFSHPRTIRDLLRGFVHEPWVAELDLETLEKLPSDYVSGQLAGEFEERNSDVVWRVKWRDRDLYVIILLELQSSCDHDMALRMLVYVALFYQRLLKERPLTRGEKLPPVFPVVFYNGDPEWWAPLEVRELIETVPESLAAHLPSLRYGLIDEKRLPLEMLEQLVDNVVAGIARVEQDHGVAHLTQMVENFARWLESPDQRELRRDVLAWLSKVVLPARVPGTEVPELQDLEEFRTYLEVKMQPWTEQWAAQGREEGLRLGTEQGREEGLRLGTEQGREEGLRLGAEQGREEGLRLGTEQGREEGLRLGAEQGREEGLRLGAERGRLEGERSLFRRLLQTKFGSAGEAIDRRIDSADSDQLIDWSSRLLAAETIDDVFTGSEP
ncbi:MAG: Rpn family recombination-promoting nuclease/putative transposase [Acidobacteriota bacterium]